MEKLKYMPNKKEEFIRQKCRYGYYYKTYAILSGVSLKFEGLICFSLFNNFNLGGGIENLADLLVPVVLEDYT